MTQIHTTEARKSKRFLAFLLAVAFLASALPVVWFCRALRAEEPLPETNNHVFHDNEYFELYHRVNGEVVSKKLEYMYAETTTSGQMRPVYCVRAGAPSPETGSIEPAVMHDAGAAALLGKIQYIIEMDESSFAIPDTINGHPHIHYCVRQILIWHLVHLYQGSLGSEAQQYFAGIDLDTFADGEGSGPTAVTILAEAKRLWAQYDQAGRPSQAGAFVPHYQTQIEHVSKMTYDAASHTFRATFAVQVEETVKGNVGGTFRFNNYSGGTVYLTDSAGRAVRAVTTRDTFPSGSTFLIQGQWKDMRVKEQAREMLVSVEVVSNGENNRSQLMYGYFFDSGLAANGQPRQTYVGWHESSEKTFSGSAQTWEEQTWQIDMSKLSVFGNIRIHEVGAGFEIYRADFSNYAQAKEAGLGFLCVSNATGRIVDQTTGEKLRLPAGEYTIRQTVVPEGTHPMNPNPASFKVVAGSGTNMSFEDEMKAGALAIEKKIQTGYDVYAGTATDALAPEAGARFAVWNVMFDSYEAAPSGYRDVLVTNEQGYAKSKILPCGEYRVHQLESEATKYTYPCADSTVRIQGTNATADPEKTLVLVDRQYELKIQIRKVNERTGEVVPAAGVRFQVLDANKQVLQDWDGRDTFETGADGTVSLARLALPAGTYYVRELQAPRGFVVSDELIRIEAKKGETFIGVGPSGDMKAVDFADKEVDVVLELEKTGEVLHDAKRVETGVSGLDGYDFSYEEMPLPGAVYELYCEKDVLDFYRDISLLDPSAYPDGAIVIDAAGKTFAPYRMFDTDGDGDAETPLKAGTLLGAYTTDGTGRIEVEGLALDAQSGRASYKMIEVAAPDGYMIDPTPVLFDVSDDRTDRTVPFVRATRRVTDVRQQAVVTCEKHGRDYVFDATSGTYVTEERALSSAVLGIYAAAPICAPSGEVLVEEDALIEVLVSDSEGRCTSTVDYPMGASLYIREIAAPEGYLLSSAYYPVGVLKTRGVETVPVLTFAPATPIVNEQGRARIAVTKTAADTGLPMENVEFEVYTKEGELVEKLITDEEGIVYTRVAYPYGTDLVLHEVRTDSKYARGEDVVVHISAQQESENVFPLQPCSIVNYPLSEIRIEKHCGDGSHTPMDGVTFQLWAVGNGDEADQLIAEARTDEHGVASFFAGPGEYYFLETDVGNWTHFRVMDEPIPVTCGKEGKLIYFEVVDAPTEIVAEKRAAASGELLGNCGMSVRDASGRIYDFIWDEEAKGYVACEAGTPAATQVLFTENDIESPQYGTIAMLGLDAGEYEIFEVQAPEGYRNDSESMPVTVENGRVLGATRLYDTVKTSETEMLIGIGWCVVFGLSGTALMSMGVMEFVRIWKRRRD